MSRCLHSWECCSKAELIWCDRRRSTAKSSGEQTCSVIKVMSGSDANETRGCYEATGLKKIYRFISPRIEVAFGEK